MYRPLSPWRMANATPDLWLPSQPWGITALWLVPTYTAWWTEAHACEQLAQGALARSRSQDLSVTSPARYRYTIKPHSAIIASWTAAYCVSTRLTSSPVAEWLFTWKTWKSRNFQVFLINSHFLTGLFLINVWQWFSTSALNSILMNFCVL